MSDDPVPWEMLARAEASWCVGSLVMEEPLWCGGFFTLRFQAELLFLRRFFLIDVQLLLMLPALIL